MAWFTLGTIIERDFNGEWERGKVEFGWHRSRGTWIEIKYTSASKEYGYNGKGAF